MSDHISDHPHRLLRTPEAARYLGLSGRTLEKHRTYGTGPAYHKLGGRVVYAIPDLDIWAARGRRGSTSDPGTDTVLPARWPDGQGPAAQRGAPEQQAPRPSSATRPAPAPRAPKR
jgi:predicted DNA-binding transcriptional regulator AlpA